MRGPLGVEIRLEGTALSPLDQLRYALGWLLLYRPLRERLGLVRVKTAGSGAAPIAPAVLEFFWAIGVPVHEGYGQTEGSALATFNPSERARIGIVLHWLLPDAAWEWLMDSSVRAFAKRVAKAGGGPAAGR